MKLSSEVRRAEIEGAESNDSFFERDGGEIVHLALVVSSPSHSAMGGRDLVYFHGRFPDSIARAEESQAACVRVFVEVEADRFVHLGLSRVIALRHRLGQPELAGFQTEAELGDAWLERVAPEVLRPPRSVSVDVFVELTRSGDVWRASVPSVDVDERAPTYHEALRAAQDEAIARILHALADGDESARPSKPDVEGLRALDSPSHGWPMADIEASSRVVVRVNAYSADLDVPGWALSYDEIWYRPNE